MNRGTFLKDSNGDWLVNFEDNESDIPQPPFDAWVIMPKEYEAKLAQLRADLQAAQQRIAALEAAGGELYRCWKSCEPGLDVAIPKKSLLQMYAREIIDRAIKQWEELHPARATESNPQ